MAAGSRINADLLRELLRGLRVNPGVARAALLQCATRGPQEFVDAVFGLTEQELEAPGAEVLSGLVCKNPEVLARILDPQRTPMPMASAMARLASCADVGFAARLAQRIGVSPLERGPWSYRALDVLGALCGGPRVLPYLVHLTGDQDRFIRSRVALLAGRAKRDPVWMARLLDDPDPRVRANAVESLWGIRAGTQFDAAGRDYHHRVSANAVVGLHITGESNAVDRMIALLEHRDPLFQAAGAWAAGRCREAAVHEWLQRLAQTRGAPRGAALRALVALRKAGVVPLENCTASPRGLLS